MHDTLPTVPVTPVPVTPGPGPVTGPVTRATPLWRTENDGFATRGTEANLPHPAAASRVRVREKRARVHASERARWSAANNNFCKGMLIPP